MTQRRVKRKPSTIPTPIPPAKIAAGNLLPSLVGLAVEPDAMAADVDVEVDEEVGISVEEDVEEVTELETVLEDFADVSVLLEPEEPDEAEDVLSFPDLLALKIRPQTALSSLLDEIQLYPKGQHFDPHVGSLSRTLVVKMLASGFFEASCKLISQGIVAMLLQVFPSGQHKAEVPLSSDMQLDPASHLKESGSLESTALQESWDCRVRRDLDVDESRSESPDA